MGLLWPMKWEVAEMTVSVRGRSLRRPLVFHPRFCVLMIGHEKCIPEVAAGSLAWGGGGSPRKKHVEQTRTNLGLEAGPRLGVGECGNGLRCKIKGDAKTLRDRVSCNILKIKSNIKNSLL